MAKKRYFEVLDDDNVIFPEGDNNMSEMSTLRDQIGALQLAVQKNEHENLDRLRDRDDRVKILDTKIDGFWGSLSSAVDLIKRVQETGAEQVAGLQAQLAERPTEERVRELTTECISDPDGSACQILDGMAREVVAETQAEGGLHISPDEPELLSDAMKKQKERNPKKFAEMLSGMGYEKPAKKNSKLDPLFQD